MRLRVLLLLAGLLVPAPAAAQAVGEVLEGPAEVIDGGSVRVGSQPLLLYGIAAIARHEPLGDASAGKLQQIIAGRPLTCTVVDLRAGPGGPERDAVCKVAGRNGADIAAIMVDTGWAAVVKSRELRRIRPDVIETYGRLQVDARSDCIGLWRALPECRS